MSKKKSAEEMLEEQESLDESAVEADSFSKEDMSIGLDEPKKEIKVKLNEKDFITYQELEELRGKSEEEVKIEAVHNFIQKNGRFVKKYKIRK